MVQSHHPTPPSTHKTHPPPLSLSLNLLSQMAQRDSLKAFDPHAIHYFTNNNVLDRHQPPALPSKYPRPIPSSVTQYTANTQSTPNIVHSPAPRRPTTLVNSQQSSNVSYQKPIFTTFKLDRSSPELEEILLRTQLTRALGPGALGLDVKHDAYTSS